MDIFISYTSRTEDWGLPFLFGKGSRAALEGATREHVGAPREQRASRGEHARGRRRTGRACSTDSSESGCHVSSNTFDNFDMHEQLDQNI